MIIYYKKGDMCTGFRPLRLVDDSLSFSIYSLGLGLLKIVDVTLVSI